MGTRQNGSLNAETQHGTTAWGPVPLDLRLDAPPASFLSFVKALCCLLSSKSLEPLAIFLLRCSVAPDQFPCRTPQLPLGSSLMRPSFGITTIRLSPTPVVYGW